MDFEGIYGEYYPRVFRLCMGYVNDSAWAHDLAQDTFIAVWKNLPGFRNQAAVGTWIYRIATNTCLRSVEKEEKRSRLRLPVEIQEFSPPDVEERLQLLYKCISELKEPERIIISLVLEGLPQAEIAAIVGISEANIRVKVHRIKERLTQKYKAHGQL